jgi:uncharacterized repeat protein (TIGR03803 family)
MLNQVRLQNRIAAIARQAAMGMLGFGMVLSPIFLASQSSQAQTYTILHNFTGADGASPEAALIEDSSGNLYGTTNYGGNGSGSGACDGGCGTIFSLSSGGTLTTLYQFQGTSDGAVPYESLVRDGAGNLYGATTYAGTGTCAETSACGTLYELSAAGKFRVLVTFNGSNGSTPPPGRLTTDSLGNLYGVTSAGGAAEEGVVYKVNMKQPTKEVVINDFAITASNTGYSPFGGLVQESGTYYGVTEFGGTCPYGGIFGGGCGTIYKLNSSGQTQLYSWMGSTDGANPNEDLTRDSAGNLYGTTSTGGDVNCAQPTARQNGSSTFWSNHSPSNHARQIPPMEQSPPGCGVVFKFDPTTNTETVLYAFANTTDGAFPVAGVVLDKEGNIYGTTESGGDLGCDSGEGCGVVYKIDTAGNFTVLHTFDETDGDAPGWGALLLDSSGNLYGATGAGGTTNHGVIFKIVP